MTAMSAEQPAGNLGVKGRCGSDPAAEKIRMLPFGEITWPMSGNEIIAEVDC